MMDYPRIHMPIVRYCKYRSRIALEHNMNAEFWQTRALMHNVRKAEKTAFGRDHDFSSIRSYDDFRKAVPVRTYSDFQSEYFNRILRGEKDICWPGRIPYLLKSCGTTGQRKTVPTSAEGVASLRNGMAKVAFYVVAETSRIRFLTGKRVILGDTWRPEIDENEIRTNRVSALAWTLPYPIRKTLCLPSRKTGGIRDTEARLDAIVRESAEHDVVQISGNPIWLISFIRKVRKHHGLSEGDTLKDVWPGLVACISSGDSLTPVRDAFRAHLGGDVLIWDAYAATEGLIAMRDSDHLYDLLVQADSRFFFEFISADEHGTPGARRFALWEVEKDVEYVVVITNNSGLFSYSLEDTVMFTSTAPYRLVVTGRVPLVLRTFDDKIGCRKIEIIVGELARRTQCQIEKFTICPSRKTSSTSSAHHLYIEYNREPSVDGAATARILDEEFRAVSVMYDQYRSLEMLRPPEVTVVPSGGFRSWIQKFKNDDAQVKVPVVRNDHEIADQMDVVIAGMREME